VDPPDPESPVRICLTNNEEQGLRFGWPNSLEYWCFMGEEVEVEPIEGVWDISNHQMIKKHKESGP